MEKSQEEVRIFYNDDIADALQDCQKAGFQAVSAPKLADMCIKGLAPWDQYSTTTSPIITGIPTGETEAFVLYWHEPTAFVTPQGLRRAKKDVVDGAGRVDQTSLDTIYRLAVAQKPHLIIPYRKLLELTSGTISIKAAEHDSRVKAALDGQECVGKFLPAFAKTYNTKEISVWHQNDFDTRTPRFRLLFLGGGGDGGLSGSDGLKGYGQFTGVRQTSAQNLDEQLITREELEEAEGKLKFDDVLDKAYQEFWKGIAHLQRKKQ